MKQILVISGKGGTGKTILTASFAALAQNKVMVDCDVDAADLHLILHPTIKETYAFKSGKTARINASSCISLVMRKSAVESNNTIIRDDCTRCSDVCRFDAISKDFVIDPVSCEGCGLCSRVCPCQAIVMEENNSGEWYISDTQYGPLVYAKLGIAEENSGKLVMQVRKAAKELADKQGRDFVIIDGPPGIGCPVITSLSGVDMAVIVTEPTLSGLHDMQRVMEVAEHFKVAVGVVINKFDLNVEQSGVIKEFCAVHGVPVLGEIPFSPEVSASIVQGIPAVDFCKDGTAEKIIAVWEQVCSSVAG
jgi:MinD superfamily P-loop ATPase